MYCVSSPDNIQLVFFFYFFFYFFLFSCLYYLIVSYQEIILLKIIRETQIRVKITISYLFIMYAYTLNKNKIMNKFIYDT